MIKFTVSQISLNISQYESPDFEGTPEVIVGILQNAFILLLEDREAGEITASFFRTTLEKLVGFIERNNLTASKKIDYERIKKERDSQSPPIEQKVSKNDQ